MAARKRTQRRESDRQAQKLAKARLDLARLEPGGSAERPEVLASASVVEPHAEAQPCYACAGTVRVLDHRAEAGLRVVQVRCKDCGRPRDLYFKVRERTLN